MFAIELVKGKDAPPQITKQFEQHGKTAGLLLRMLQLYFHTARCIVLDWLLCAQGHHRAAQEWFVWLQANQKMEVLAGWHTGGRDATIL